MGNEKRKGGKRRNPMEYEARKMIEAGTMPFRDIAFVTGVNVGHVDRTNYEGRGMPELKKGFIR